MFGFPMSCAAQSVTVEDTLFGFGNDDAVSDVPVASFAPAVIAQDTLFGFEEPALNCATQDPTPSDVLFGFASNYGADQMAYVPAPTGTPNPEDELFGFQASADPYSTMQQPDVWATAAPPISASVNEYGFTIDSNKYDFGFDIDYIRYTEEQLKEEEDSDIISKLPPDYAENCVCKNDLADLMRSEPVVKIVVPHQVHSGEYSDEDLDHEVKRLHALDFMEKRTEIKQALRVQREQEQLRMLQEQQAAAAAMTVAAPQPQQQMYQQPQIQQVYVQPQVPAAPPVRLQQPLIPSVPAKQEPQPMMELLSLTSIAPAHEPQSRTAYLVPQPVPAQPQKQTQNLIPSAPPQVASSAPLVPSVAPIPEASAAADTPAEPLIDDLFGFGPTELPVQAQAPTPTPTPIQPAPVTVDMEKVEDLSPQTQDRPTQPIGEAVKSDGPHLFSKDLSIKDQLLKIESEIQKRQHDIVFIRADALADGRSSAHAKALRYLSTKTYKDPHDTFMPSRRLQSYYAAHRTPEKPKESIYSPYSDRELMKQRERVRAEITAQKLSEQEIEKYYEKLELKRLTSMYLKLESELNAKTISSEFAQEKRRAFEQLILEGQEAASGSSHQSKLRTASGSGPDTLKLHTTENNVVHLHKSLFYAPNGTFKNHVHYLDYQKVYDRFSHSQVVLFMFAVSSQERKFKQISKRYDDFSVLHKNLVKVFGQLILPELPSLRSVRLGGGRHEVIHETQEKLTAYLTKINDMQAVRTCTIYRNFLRHHDVNFFQELLHY